MKPASLFHKGLDNRPLVVFIHGLGMDMHIWTNPGEMRILGGLYPLKVLLPDFNGEMTTSFTDLKELGLNLLAWSQERPFGPISVAVKELGTLMKDFMEYAANGIILVGHSRGGLVGRIYLESRPELIRGLITVAAPHHGSGMVGWSVHLSPIASFLEKFLEQAPEKDFKKAFKRILGFFAGEGVRELLPGSPLYSGLKDSVEPGVQCISLGGTNPDLLRIKNISLSEIFSKVVPGKLIPEEMTEGLGDGLVSAASSELPYASKHTNFHANHISILFDKGARKLIAAAVETFGKT